MFKDRHQKRSSAKGAVHVTFTQLLNGCGPVGKVLRPPFWRGSQVETDPNNQSVGEATPFCATLAKDAAELSIASHYVIGPLQPALR
jgi:hypothetical protein